MDIHLTEGRGFFGVISRLAAGTCILVVVMDDAAEDECATSVYNFYSDAGTPSSASGCGHAFTIVFGIWTSRIALQGMLQVHRRSRSRNPVWPEYGSRHFRFDSQIRPFPQL